MSIVIPNYSLLKKLGAGAFAEVWLAEHQHNRRKAAIKILKESVEVGSDAEKLFLREGEVLASFDHPNIVRIFDNAKVGDHAYLVMEYLPGGSLQERMSQRGIEVGEAIGYVVQVAGALDAAHQRDIIHRDLKPANIMLRNDTTPVLTDFGASRLLKRSTIYGRDGGVIGTPQYMSPEQIRGEPLDGRSDLYALGVMFHELLTGRVPFEGTVTEVISMHLAATPGRLPAEQAVLQPILDRLLAKTPEQRFASGVELCDELRRAFLDEEALRRLVLQVSPASAWSSQLRALGFQLDTQRRSEVRIAQGKDLQAQLGVPPTVPSVADPQPAPPPSQWVPPPIPQPVLPAAPIAPVPPPYIPQPPAFIAPPSTATGVRTSIRVLSYVMAALGFYGGVSGLQGTAIFDLLIVSFAVLTAFQWLVARSAWQQGRPVVRVFSWIFFVPVVLALLVAVGLSSGQPPTQEQADALLILPVAMLASLITALTVLIISKPKFGIPAAVLLLVLAGISSGNEDNLRLQQTVGIIGWLVICAMWVLLGLFADLRRSRT